MSGSLKYSSNILYKYHVIRLVLLTGASSPLFGGEIPALDQGTLKRACQALTGWLGLEAELPVATIMISIPDDRLDRRCDMR